MILSYSLRGCSTDERFGACFKFADAYKHGLLVLCRQSLLSCATIKSSSFHFTNKVIFLSPMYSAQKGARSRRKSFTEHIIPEPCSSALRSFGIRPMQALCFQHRCSGARTQTTTTGPLFVIFSHVNRTTAWSPDGLQFF